jgi:hypothetical protein
MRSSSSPWRRDLSPRADTTTTAHVSVISASVVRAGQSARKTSYSMAGSYVSAAAISVVLRRPNIGQGAFLSRRLVRSE